MAEAPRPPQGLIDTSVVIDLDHLDAERLPRELAISALAYNGPRPASIHCRSTATRRGPMDASTPRSSRRGAKHVAPEPSIC